VFGYEIFLKNFTDGKRIIGERYEWQINILKFQSSAKSLKGGLYEIGLELHVSKSTGE
jgi:hypothetical protein